ncbi:MAG: cyclic nucleotide-binding domain-containing protein [Methylobacter sp.]|nr:cyclic nucleotide-binding domain-containing protein [Methylobacter sp.]MDP2426775.1 cyclic nucleotide-binding domain-containing protein [Methylobacter sp.]MDP3054675.1 cyclic nucleotide-binding domain-containing protein [Methylobacter sp.]MDP3361727.1 cyclic nucleotide-binding domain-containing protein [Methylobacter sp.]MDZ4219472.1 cyclic nucleotide-binding domain-containing protein [Methylobacter sp.]
MAVAVDSEDRPIIHKLIPLATIPGAQFDALCAEITVEEIQDDLLFKRGDTEPQLVYLISGEVTLQAAGMVVEVIAANSDSAKFALAHQIPRKIDAVANGTVRFFRLDADIIKNLPPLAYKADKEDNSYMVIDEAENDPDDWMTALLRSPIFQRLPPANLQKILTGLESIDFNKGETILEQGGIGDYYYLIKKGQCLLTRKPSPNAKEIKLAQLGNGDTFGEDSLLSGAPRNVTITALTDITLLRLDKQQFVTLIKEPSLKFIDFAQMQQAVQQGAVLLDVRSPDDYDQHHIDGSISAPFFSLRMQLKTLSHDKPVVVVCQDGKVSEAAAFLLLRNKIEAMILRGGMDSLAPKPVIAYASDVISAPANNADLDIEQIQLPDHHAMPVVQHIPASDSASSGLADEQIKALKLENEALKNANQQLNEKCMKLEFDKQHAEKQCRILHKQMEKLTQVLDKLKGG